MAGAGRRLLGLAWAAAAGAGLWLLWPEARGLLKGTWLNDLRFPAALVYACFGLWIAERIWAMIAARFAGGRAPDAGGQP